MADFSEEYADHAEYELIRRCQNGDASAMAKIVKEYENRVFSTAFGLLGDHDDALDIAQDVFVSIWEKIGQFQFRSKLSTWIYRITKNLAINEKNKRKRRKTDPTEINDSQVWVPIDERTPETDLIITEQKKLVYESLDRLKEKHRTILILREMENLSYQEISEILGCSLGRVKSRLHEARMELRKIFNEMIK